MEALLEMQQSFADSKISSSVEIKKKSLFAQRSEKLKVVPSVITSKSNLFDGVLSEVVEKENMEFKDSRITFQKHGFPTASHRGSNVSKVEVQQSPKAAKKPVPANYPELEKLKWITDGPAPALADKLGLRFNFSGEILQSSAENLENTGMFHHGDEYSRPGYTLAEFSHLSKSTFPAQRVVALKSLTCIIRKLYDGNYKDLSALISKTCSELNLLLSARIGMDSHHSTVVDHSIDFIAAYIGCSGPYLELYDTLMNTITGKRILAVEKNSLSAFTEAPIKSDEEIDASIAGIMHSLYSDPLLGLLMTQIIVRIRFLLVDELASIERKLQLVAILSKLSTHSVSSCEDIMSCDGLIDILHSEIFQIAWPPPEQSIKTDYLCALLRLIRLLCLSSREATLALNKLRIFQSLMRFISIFSSDTRPIFAVQFQIFSLLNVCLSYGVCASILDEYHFILFENGKFLLDSIQKSVHNHSEHSFNTMTAAVVSWISLLNDALLLFRNSLNPGGKDDAFLPFLNIAAEILNQSVLRMRLI